MKCPRCQRENRPGAKFCEECATPFARACSKCGSALSPTAKFCPECAEPTSAPPAQARFGSPGSYTPKHLAEKIRTSKAALEGERKQVTVVFADLKGSMELLAERDPEEARKILDPVLELMMEAVHRYEGTVNQVMGDGIMALFGAPLAHEDHAVRACYAALQMQEAVKRYAEEVRRSEGFIVQIRVGLNSGEVVVRSIGSDLHTDYTAVGQTTHLAARMEQLAAPGTVLASVETLRLAEGYVEVKPLGPVNVKGLGEPIEVYEISGASPARTRLQAAVARGLTRFVGRDTELETLRRAIELAAQGHGQVVAVVGEPGIGKSRLFWELIRSHRTHGWLILESGSASYGKATAFLPLINLLKAYFQIESRDDPRTIREKVTDKLLTLDHALVTDLPALLALVDVPVSEPAWQALDPAQRRQRTLEAVKRLLLRESQIQPLLLIFEDLHWLDGQSQAVLDSVAEGLPTARIVLLVNYRPEYEHDWGSKTYYTQLRLDPLPADSARELLGTLLGTDASVRALKELLIERTDGNPFFLEECVCTLVETKILVGERGAYRATGPLEQIQVPATVQTVLAARIDRLPAEEKSLLQVASVIGEHVPFVLLQAVADLPEERLRATLSCLQAAEFLYEVSIFPELEYMFKHGLTHQVAYGSLLHESRRVLHARIVTAIERLYPGAIDEHVEELARHAYQAEAWDTAVVYLRRAGLKSAKRTAYRIAADWLEKALVALSRNPEQSTATAIDIRFDLRHAYLSLGEMDRALALVQEAQTLASAAEDQRRLATALALSAAHLTFSGITDVRAVEDAERALSISAKFGDGGLRAVATFLIGRVHYIRGNYGLAAEHLRASIAYLGPETTRDVTGFTYLPAVNFRTWLSWSLAELGSFNEALDVASRALSLAREARSSYDEVLASCAMGGTQLRHGDADHAVGLLERALSLCRTWELHLLYMPTASRLSYAYALSRHPTEARELVDEVCRRPEIAAIIADPEAGSVTSLATLWLIWLGQALFVVGDVEKSARLIRSTMTAAACSGQRGIEAWANHTMAQIALASEPLDVALARHSLSRAQRAAVQLQMRPLLAHCYLSLGLLAHAVGNRAEAQRALAMSVDEYTSLSMTRWADQTRAKLAAVN